MQFCPFSAFEIIKEELPDEEFEEWERKTDNAVSQFKSQFVVNNLLNVNEKVSPRLKNVSFNYFESHEGKNLSDTIGAIGKQAFNRAKNRTSILNDGVGSVEPDVDQDMVICNQVKDMILSGLTFEDGRVGDFAFFR